MDEIEVKEIEVLKKQNEALVAALKETKTFVDEIRLYNVKLAYSIRLLCEIHFTRDEKLLIAEEIDNANNADQVEKIYNRHMSNVKREDVFVEPDFVWSGGFARDIGKYFFKYKGYNPFQNIEEAMVIIREHFKIEESLRLTEDSQKVEQLKEKWLDSWDVSQGALNDIMSVINEVNGK